MTETLTVTPELLRVLLALPERLAALEQAVRDLAARIESGERSAKCKLVHLPPARERLLAALPATSPGIPAREAARLAGCNKQYAHQLLLEMRAAGLVERAETTTDRNGTQLYWRDERTTGGESDERSARALMLLSSVQGRSAERVLASLPDAPGSTCREVAQATGYTVQRTHEVLHVLLDVGLVEQVEDPAATSGVQLYWRPGPPPGTL